MCGKKNFLEIVLQEHPMAYFDNYMFNWEIITSTHNVFLQINTAIYSIKNII
jgi:hypothetical protein